MRDKLKKSIVRFSDTFDISSQGFVQDSLERRKQSHECYRQPIEENIDETVGLRSTNAY